MHLKGKYIMVEILKTILITPLSCNKLFSSAKHVVDTLNDWSSQYAATQYKTHLFFLFFNKQSSSTSNALFIISAQWAS